MEAMKILQNVPQVVWLWVQTLAHINVNTVQWRCKTIFELLWFSFHKHNAKLPEEQIL